LPAASLPRASSLARTHASVAVAQLLPSVVFLAAFFAAGTGTLACSFTQAPNGTLGLPGLQHYRHFFDVPLTHVLLTTLRISLVTTSVGIALGYPIALVMVRTNPVVSRIITMIVIAPLIVSVAVRTYGWQLILANGKTGILNWLLLATGLAKSPVALLYSETAVVIGSLHVFYPMMVLPLASALGRIDARIEDAARTLGATSWRIFRRIPCRSVCPDWRGLHWCCADCRIERFWR
jgi:putative spermidine/putrescine transport system permease protein